MSYYQGILKGISYGRKWKHLQSKCLQLKIVVQQFENSLLDTFVVRLLPKIHILERQLNDEAEDMEENMSDETNEFRPSDLQNAIAYLDILQLQLSSIAEQHNKRSRAPVTV